MLLGQNERRVALTLRETLKAVSYAEDQVLSKFMRSLEAVHEFTREAVTVPFKVG